MGLDEFLPFVNNVLGGVLMAVAIWAMATGRINFPRELKVIQDLYDKEVARSERFETMNTELVKELAKQNDGHIATLELFQKFIPGVSPTGHSPESHPMRRRDDRATS